MASTKITYTQVTGSTNGTKIFTISAWVKRGAIGGGEPIWSSGTASTDSIDFHIDSNDCCVFESWDNSVNPKITTTRKLRDPAAWYHIVIAVDSTESVSTDRMKMWINGVQETVFTASVYPSLNYDFPGTGVASDIVKIAVGTQASYTAKYWSGEMSHFHFTEGTAYTASTFGETDSTSGIWKIKTSPTVTYGNNGFFLKMEDSSNMDLDSSSNALTFTTTGTLTATKDNPSNNFITLNPLEYMGNSSPTFSNGNNTYLQGGSSKYFPASGTIGLSGGLWYWEVRTYDAGTNMLVGIAGDAGIQTNMIGSDNSVIGYSAQQWAYHGDNGNYRTNNAYVSYGSTWGQYDIIGVYLDLNANKLYFAKAGVIQNSGTGISITAPASTKAGYYVPASSFWGGANTFQYNFGGGYLGTSALSSAVADAGGEGLFEYDPSAGTFDSTSKDFRAVCTKNIKAYGG